MSAVVGAVGTLLTGQSQAAMYEHNANVNRINARTTVAEAEEKRRRHERLIRIAQGSFSAARGGSGVEMSGSTLEALNDSAIEGALQAETIRYDGQQRAWAFNQKASMDTYKANTTRVTSYIGAGTQILGAVESGIGLGNMG